MIGGQVIENAIVTVDDGRDLRRLWVVDRCSTLEAALYTPPEFGSGVKIGDTVWKQAGRLYHGDVEAGPHLGIRYAPFDGDTLKEGS
jgi:hypothetical protein